jgi:hypothetical protein
VKLEFTEHGRIAANIVVERPETLDALHRDVRGLERALHQAGVSSDGDKLEYNLRGHDGNSRLGAGSHSLTDNSGDGHGPTTQEHPDTGQGSEAPLAERDMEPNATMSPPPWQRAWVSTGVDLEV